MISMIGFAATGIITIYGMFLGPNRFWINATFVTFCIMLSLFSIVQNRKYTSAYKEAQKEQAQEEHPDGSSLRVLHVRLVNEIIFQIIVALMSLFMLYIVVIRAIVNGVPVLV
jgi:hypothetical protein